MEDELLKMKMDELGQLMHDWEEAERKLMQDWKDRLEKIEAMKDEIKQVLLERQTTVQSDKLECVWRKGATRWDSKMLADMLKDNPWLGAARKTGDPTVSFKLRGEGWDERDQ